VTRDSFLFKADADASKGAGGSGLHAHSSPKV
jgi:hypothetical protein